MARVFESPPDLFHTVFNRTVENFYKVFIKSSASFGSVARKLLRSRDSLQSPKSRHFGAA